MRIKITTAKISISAAIISFLVFAGLNANAQIIDLSSTKNFSKALNLSGAEVFKPTKLVIGTSTRFRIKATPESHVSLITSDENYGSEFLKNHTLRLGNIINTKEIVAGKNGVAEIDIDLPSENALIGKLLYFEVIVWNNADYSDLQIAKIIDANGRETNNNALLIMAPPKNANIPSLTPQFTNHGDINNALDMVGKMNKKNESRPDVINSDNIYDDSSMYGTEPLILRNLRLPETKNLK